jgi:hypothetical protein
MTIAQRLHCCLDNEIGRAKIRLTDSEIDDVAALRRKLGGAGENGEGVLLADAIECRMRQQFSTWAALEPNCFSKANIRAHAALQYDGLVGPRKTGVRARTG